VAGGQVQSMGSETEILTRQQGKGEIRRQQGKKAEEGEKLSRIAVVCPAPACGLAFVELNALGVHAQKKHGMKFKMPSCVVKSDQRKRMQSYRGQKVSEGLRRYHRKRRMTAPSQQEDLSPLLAQADQLLATIKTQPQQQLPRFQRLHYRLHPPPLFPQPQEPSDDHQEAEVEESGYQMPPHCLLINPNTSPFQTHSSYGTSHQHDLNQNFQTAPNFTQFPMLPSFPSAFQQAAVPDAVHGAAWTPWYQMPASRNPWIAPVDTVEADERTYRVL